jgi:hypothetical protein
MTEKSNKPSLRLLMLITHPKFSDKASKMLMKMEIPMHYKMNAVGTASSEMMDILGLGTPDKSVLMSILPKATADEVLKKLLKELRLGSVNSGIAFTAPLSGISNLILGLYADQATEDRKDETEMTEAKYSMIAALVNPGFSEQVMKVAREAGAGGGSVVHCRRIADEATVAKIGLDVGEEKEIVLIVTGADTKLPIMQAIGKACGVHSDAKGFVFSLPIESAIGLAD